MTLLQPILKTAAIPDPQSSESLPAIAVTNLSFAYPGRAPAIAGLDMLVARGERIGIVGANGCGKTTLFLLLACVLTATTGTITILGHPVQPKAFQTHVGFVFQNPDDQLFSASVWNDVAFAPHNMGLPPDVVAQRVEAAMALTNVQDLAQLPPHHLSGGQKKRVAIAGILAMQPEILLLDEPTAQLDPRSRRQLIRLLASLPHTQLIATHDLDLALELCDRTILLSNGRIICDGDTASILGNADLLEQYALELPLSYSRPYCLLEHSPLGRVIN